VNNQSKKAKAKVKVEKKKKAKGKMAGERVTAPRFSGDKDEYSVWYLQARGYAPRFGILSAMGD
jgi:hypothetical protein